MERFVRIYHCAASNDRPGSYQAIMLDGPAIISGQAMDRDSGFALQKSFPVDANAAFKKEVAGFVAKGFNYIGTFWIKEDGTADWVNNLDADVRTAVTVPAVSTDGDMPKDWVARLVGLFKDADFGFHVAEDQRSVHIRITQNELSDEITVRPHLFPGKGIAITEGSRVRIPATQVAIIAIGYCLGWTARFALDDGTEVPIEKSRLSVSHAMFDGLDLCRFGGGNSIQSVAQALGLFPRPPRLKPNAGLQFRMLAGDQS